ncbi:MAG: hypothetical protein ACRD3D_04170 [Terriglobia bacterium]
MLCPICRKRKAKRFCPAKAATICSICCGTEREVTIDCPAGCPHLIESRRHVDEHPHSGEREIPFAKSDFNYGAFARHESLVTRLSYVICEFAAENPLLADPDIQAASQALAETYQTLANGVAYEQPPVYPIRRELYQLLQAEVKEFKEHGGSDLSLPSRLGASEIRDVLMMFTQIAALRSNGRPKGRAFLDFIRSQFKPGTFTRDEPKILLA